VQVAGPSSQRPGISPTTFHVGFVGDEVTLWWVLLRVLPVCPLIAIPLIHKSVIDALVDSVVE